MGNVEKVIFNKKEIELQKTTIELHEKLKDVLGEKACFMLLVESGGDCQVYKSSNLSSKDQCRILQETIDNINSN